MAGAVSTAAIWVILITTLSQPFHGLMGQIELIGVAEAAAIASRIGPSMAD
jgi:hypothetical protein